MDLSFSNKLFIEQEIKKVKNGDLNRFLLHAIDRFPDYFWEIPASNGKYHPPDERKQGGLVLHVRRLIKLTDHMVRFYELNFWERDVLIAASILHDSFARGVPPNISNGSDELHPIYVAQQFPYNGDAARYLDKKLYDEIMECVISHSGPFSIHVILQSKRKLPSIFQLMDYLASRDNIRIEPG